MDRDWETGMQESWKVEETVELGRKVPKTANKERWEWTTVTP
jgi:hypothetical protein